MGHKPNSNMSSLVVEPVASTSQLYFTFADAPSADAQSARQMDGIDRELTRRLDRRDARPLRIGAVMLDLLRRYGITEEEIAAGLENYANRRNSARAGHLDRAC